MAFWDRWFTPAGANPNIDAKASGSPYEGAVLASKAPAISAAWAREETFTARSLSGLIQTEEYKPLGTYAQRSVAVFACVNARSTNLSRVPLRFWKEEGNVKRVVKSGSLVTSWKRVNPFWSVVRFVRAIEDALCYYGNAYFLVDKNPRKSPTNPDGNPEFWWIHPSKIRPIRGDRYINGYLFRDLSTGMTIPFRTDEIVHIPYFYVENEFEGMSPLTAARLGIEAGIDAIKANRKFFTQGMHVGGIVSPAEEGGRFTRNQVAELEEDLARRLSGIEGSHRFLVLSGQAKVDVLGVSPKDAEFIGLMQWTLADVCRVFQVPLSIVQEVERSAYKNIGTELKAFWTLCLQPEAEFLAAELTEKLLPLFPEQADYCEFDFSGIKELQEDQTEVVLQMKILAESLRVPPNALLRKYMPDLIPDGTDGFPWGDEPIAMPGVTGLGSQIAPPKSDGDLEGNPDRRILLAQFQPTRPIDPAWRETAKGQAYIQAHAGSPANGKVEAIPTSADSLSKVLDLLGEVKADTESVPEFGSDAHKELMAAFEEDVAQPEAKAMREMATFFRAQKADILARLANQALPNAKAEEAEEAEEEDDEEKWLLLALVLLLSAYPGDDWGDQQAEIIRRLHPSLRAVADKGIAAAARDLGVEADPNVTRKLDAWIRSREIFAAETINDTTFKQIQQAIADGLKAKISIEEIAQRVGAVMDTRAGSDAAMIAETEILTTYQEAKILTYEAGGAKKIAWMTRLDNRVRDAHRRLHGQVVNVGERFTIPSGPYKGYRSRGPGQFGVLALDARCRCSTSLPKAAEPERSANGHHGLVAEIGL